MPVGRKQQCNAIMPGLQRCFTHKYSHKVLWKQTRKPQKEIKLYCLFYLHNNCIKMCTHRERETWMVMQRLTADVCYPSVCNMDRLLQQWRDGRIDATLNITHIKHIHARLPDCRLSNATPIDAVAMVTRHSACPSWCFPEDKMYGCVCERLMCPMCALLCHVQWGVVKRKTWLVGSSYHGIPLCVCVCVWSFLMVLFNISVTGQAVHPRLNTPRLGQISEWR